MNLNMKRFFKYIAVALAMSLLAIGCTPEIISLEQGKLPEASSLEVVITPDQTTNYVTFSVKNAKGFVPMWIFGEDKIDGKASKNYTYIGDEIVLRIREEGVHKVEVKAYNAHGISIGSKICEYSLDNTYRDPFDPTPYMKAMAGEWMWNSEVGGHFGCGENASNPTGWWSCGANEKADWSLYNDRMTFTADGKYTFNPGEDGKVYVNKDFTALGSGPAAEDYLVDIPTYTTTYTIESSWNDAGIEEIYLVLPENTNLSYIPNNAAYAEPRFLITDSKTSSMKKELKLVSSVPGISWYYNFIPAKSGPGPEEFLAGTEGKSWVMNAAAQGHIGCGWDADNAAGWWSAGPDEKKAFGMYDDIITFFPDGKYVYDSGKDGKMYINKEVALIGPGNATEDIDIDQDDVISTYEFDGETIKLPAGTPMVYVSSDALLEDPVFIVKELTEESLTVVTFAKTVGNPDGIAWQMMFVPYKEAEEEPEEKINMWERATKNQITTYFVSDWGQPALDVEYEIVDGGYKIVIPEGTGASQWMGQFAVNHTNIVTTKDKAYDFQFVLNSTADHPGVTIKATYFDPNKWDSNNNSWGADGDSYFADKHVLKAGEDYVYEVKGKQGLDIPCMKIVFDFGGAVGGSTVEIKDIIIKEGVLVPEEPKPETFNPGAEVDLSEVADYLPGAWTWESSTDAHFGCGPAIADPLSWWSGPANCKDGCSLYDDTMTFAEDGTYTYDPVDGMTFMNAGVTKFAGEKVDNPGSEADFRVKVDKQTATWEIDGSREYPAIVLPAGTVFSYIPNDAFLDAPELYVTKMWENQVEISAFTATGNGGGSIAWRYRLKRVQ